MPIVAMDKKMQTCGHVEAFSMLLKRGVRPRSAHNGATLLMEAVDKNRTDFVSFLLGHSHNGMAVDVAHKDDQGNNVLFYAAAAGNLAVIKDLLKAGCPVENDKFQRNILMQAVLHGHTNVVQFLFNNSKALALNVHQCDSDGRNLLFYCIEGGHLGLLQALVGCGLKMTADNRSRTNLMQAARSGNLAITKYLVENASVLNLDINAEDQNSENALFYAARSGSIDVVTVLLQAALKVQANHANVSVPPQCLSEGQFAVAKAFLTHSCNLADAINGKDIKGRTVLHHHILSGDLDSFKEQSVYYNPEMDSDLNGCSLLMAACKHTPGMELIRYLVLKMKVNVDAVDSRNRNALFYAIEAAHLQAVDFLLGHLIKVDSDLSGLSPLHVATATGNHFIVETLLKSKFGKILVNRKDKHGRNEVHYSAMHGYTSLIELLFNHESDINERDDQGLTPTTYACAHGRYASLAGLLRKGSDPDILDNLKRNAVHHCFLGTNPSLRCCKLLVKHGTNVDCRDHEGVTPLMLACRTCAETHIPIIRFLIMSGADPILQDEQGRDAFDHCPFHSEYVKALLKETTEMSPSEKEALEMFRDQLQERVEVQSCLRGLLREKIFTKTVNFEVMKRPATERVDRILQLLLLRGQNAFRGFCAVLRESGEPELAFLLLKHSYRKSEEIYW
ncbi:hypothetical protein CAPTEDRAFT_220592 [Capitella teleta]|uniref:CARD domain-containing protein n=1 Tax=Capitella teleta TaxID=283909 RepID=R7TBS1_CAPTE|nr:hypothetical protein CAPTEDRAFT_220592 [Capitella teleta]|eukprot:ELT90932.1 hypothetical protein CAPTEDRAFT_220592 [Capitella teleta]